MTGREVVGLGQEGLDFLGVRTGKEPLKSGSVPDCLFLWLPLTGCAPCPLEGGDRIFQSGLCDVCNLYP